MSGFEGNVLIEVLGRSGILLRRRRGSNAITRAGKSWAINRWVAGGGGTYTSPAVVHNQCGSSADRSPARGWRSMPAARGRT